jgi:hypothetical protein
MIIGGRQAGGAAHINCTAPERVIISLGSDEQERGGQGRVEGLVSCNGT